MANFLVILQLIASLIPIITQCIKAVEEAIPQAGQGPAKLQLLKGMLETAHQQTANASVAFDTLWPMAQVVITNLVSVYNAVGTFKQTPK